MVQLTAATPERELRQPVMRMSRPGRCALSRQLGSVTLTQLLSDRSWSWSAVDCGRFGRFREELFYRLNAIHVMLPEDEHDAVELA